MLCQLPTNTILVHYLSVVYHFLGRVSLANQYPPNNSMRYYYYGAQDKPYAEAQNDTCREGCRNENFVLPASYAILGIYVLSLVIVMSVDLLLA